MAFSKATAWQDKVQEAAEWAARKIAQDVRERILDSPEECDSMGVTSPIEKIFYAWWLALNLASESECIETFGLSPRHVKAEKVNWQIDFSVRYSKDIDVAETAHKAGIKQPDIAIELDGHEFHERTKEQVSRRNKKDRALQAVGYAVLHYSGSEIYRDPLACVKDAYDRIWGLYLPWFRRARVGMSMK